MTGDVPRPATMTEHEASLYRLEGCNCPHPAAAHDDGFGCTEAWCPCTADLTRDGFEDDIEADDDWEPCSHDHDEGCYDYQGFFRCQHQHCFACGACGCPGYCDDYQTYNLRPSETGGE
jgi:hypothetical protein